MHNMYSENKSIILKVKLLYNLFVIQHLQETLSGIIMFNLNGSIPSILVVLLHHKSKAYDT